MTMRIYRYGLRPPTAGEDLVRQQIRLAWEYRRALTQARELHRDAMREMERTSQIGPALEAVRLGARMVEEALERARRERMIGRSREAVSEDTRAEIAGARAALREARGRLRKARAAERETGRAARDACHERWLEARRALRGSYSGRGLRHGAYTAVEDAVEQSDRTTPLWSDGEPQRMRWPRWTGEGRIGEQIQGGLSVDELHAGNTRAVIAMAAPRPGDGDPSGRPRYGVLRLRVGSGDDRAPVWAEWPVKVHRPLPPGARVKRVMVMLRMEGPREVWTVDLVVDDPPGWTREPCGSGVVAVDIGWRRYPDRDGLRVAAWHDDQGRSGVIELSPEDLRELRYPEHLRSRRDQGMDAMRAGLVAWLRALDEVPEWLRARTVRRGDEVPSSAQACAWLAQWRSPARWASLRALWFERRWPGDQAGWGMLDEWARHDRHLWTWEAAQRRGAIGRRLDLYRRTAAQLARTYRTIVVEDFDLRQVVQRPQPETPETQQAEMARSWRQLASTSTLRDCIRQAAQARGGEYVQLDPSMTTQECPWDDCQHVEPWDAAAQIDRRPPCPKCGRTWDQDDGAARVLLRRWTRERDGDDGSIGGARSADDAPACDETRWDRVKRMRREKIERCVALEK